MRKLSLLACLVLALALVASYGFAAPAPATADQTATIDQMPGDEGGQSGDEVKKDRSSRDKWAQDAHKKPSKPKEKTKYKPWGKIIDDDAKKHEGLFELYTKGEDVYFAISKEQLDKPYLIFMSLSKGIGTRFVLGGLPVTGSIMFDFHRTEDHIQIRQLNTLFRAPEDEALRKSIDLTFGNSVLASQEIESEKDDKVLVKMSDFFLSDISDLGFWLQLSLQKPVRMDPKKGHFEYIKNFPENTEIDTRLTYMPGDRRGLSIPSVPDNRYLELGVHFSIHLLPENPMKPRLSDDRVGYFLTSYKDFSRDTDESFFVHYINRWRLEKKDPNAAMSDPVKPITFYVDETVPKEYRRYVAEGIELWQRAFEKAGFTNAIVAGDPEGVENYDPEDRRFNTIRWIVSDQPSFGAIGPSRVDPRTGEILDSDILVEQNMISGFRKAYRRYSGPDAFAMVDPFTKYLEDPAADPAQADMDQLRRHFLSQCGMCDIGYGFSENFNFLQLALLYQGAMGAGMDVPEKYVGDAIRYVVAHEVGHTLGLRHNFKSSISTPYDKLNDKATIEQIGMTGSVMDYSAPNVARNRDAQGYYYSPVVGTYDKWAIEWGYKPLSGDLTPAQEWDKLANLAAKADEKQHAYGTDEDTYPAGALDPQSSIWDLSDDPIAWAKERMGVCQDILSDAKLTERVVGDGGNYVPLRTAVQTLLIQEYIAASRAVRYVGGQYTARPHKGDGSGEMPLMPASADEQRDAMNFIIENALSKNSFAISPDVLNSLQDDKTWSWENNLFAYGRRFDFPLEAWVEMLQGNIVAQLLHPMRLQRMTDAQYKQENPYKLSEMYRTLTKTIWTDNMVATGRTAAMQRNLQRLYLSHLIATAVHPNPMTPPEAVALSRLQLSRLRGQINTAYSTSGLNDEANAHLSESLARIDRALDAKMMSGY